MQATDNFKAVITNHLQGLTDNDPLFAEVLKKPTKNINDCATYILNEVKKSGQNGFADDEIFGMAVHYYQEDDIKIGDPVSAKVVVNHHIDAPAKITPQPQAKKVEKQKVEKKEDVFVQPHLF